MSRTHNKIQVNITPLNEDISVGVPPPKQGGSTNPTYHFESNELSGFLGFKNNRIAEVGFTSKFIPT